jgi:hypothetical protein
LDRDDRCNSRRDRGLEIHRLANATATATATEQDCCAGSGTDTVIVDLTRT